MVINFQNTLLSPTFHVAPLLTALWFFLKPEVLTTPRCTPSSVHVNPFIKTMFVDIASPYPFSLWLSGKVAVETHIEGQWKRETGSPGTWVQGGWGYHFHFSLSFPFKKKKKGRGVIGWKGREQTPEQYVSSRGGWWEQSPEK